MPRRFFFFPHGLENASPPGKLSSGTPPWRVAHAIRGSLVNRSGTTRVDGMVMGDGYQLRGQVPMIGGNQDPCLFASPLTILHAFCRTVRRQGNDNDVVELSGARRGLLSQVVEEGDVVFYGKPKLRSYIAVDTVLAVESTRAFADVRDSVPRDSDAWAFSVSDAAEFGSHAGEDRQLVIVGRADPTWSSVTSLATSFIPPAQRNIDGRWQVLRVAPGDLGEDFEPLMDRFDSAMFVGRGAIAQKGLICELSASTGEALARAVIRRSEQAAPGGVFVPPLHVRGTPTRFGADGRARSGEDHLARLR